MVSPPPLGRVFAAEQGLIFNAIRPDKVTDFETVIAKLRAALTNSKDPVRNQQGWGWKIFKAAEPGPNGSVLYVFVMDPAVKGADYGVGEDSCGGVSDRNHGAVPDVHGCVCHGRTDVDEPAARCRDAGVHQRRPRTLTPDT